MKQILLLLTLIASTTMAWAEGSGTAENPWESGDCNVTLINGTLTISKKAGDGNGAMADYHYNADVINSPWWDSRNDITAVVVNEGVTVIGEYAFGILENLASASIASSVTSVGQQAFAYCDKLSSVLFHASGLTTYGQNAFLSHHADLTIYVPQANVAAYTTGWSTYAGIIQGFNGILGNGLIWGLDAEGILSITKVGPGSGEMNTVYSASALPWDNKRSQITGVIVGNGVKNLVDYVFQDCQNLTSATIAGTVTIIGKYAFQNCNNSAFTSIHLPMGVKTLDNYAFDGCQHLTSIQFPNSMENIGRNVFSGCSDLTTVTIGTGVYFIGENSFSGCNALENVYCYANPDGLNWEITSSDFKPEKATMIHVFSNYLSAYQSLFSSSNVTLKGMTGPSGTTTTWALTSDNQLIIGGSGAMTNYQSPEDTPWYRHKDYFSSVVIGKDVTSIGQQAFHGYTNVTDIHCYPNPKFLTWMANSEEFKPEKATTCHVSPYHLAEYLLRFPLVNVTFDSEVASTRAGTWNDGKCSFKFYPDGTLCIDGTDQLVQTNLWDSFKPEVRSIIIGDGFTSIGERALENFGNAASLTIGKGVKIIHSYAFHYGGFTTVDIPDNVNRIEGWAFGYCKNLTNITLGRGINYIGTLAFDECLNVEKVYCFSDPRSVEWRTINKCIELFPGLTMYICDFKKEAGTKCFLQRAFYGYNSRWEVNLSYSYFEGNTDQCLWDVNVDWWNQPVRLRIHGHGNMANYNLDNNKAPWYYARKHLRQIVLDNDVTNIGAYAFAECTHSDLTNITIPNKVTTIGEGAFYGCNTLTSVNIPSSVTAIYEDAFRGCFGVKHIYCYANPDNLTWQDTAGDDFMPGGATICHVLPGNLTSFQTKFGNNNVTFVEDLADEGGIIWKIENDVLDITKANGISGPMSDYAEGSAPWYAYRGVITGVVIGDGITTIGNNAFAGFNNLNSIQIPSSVTSIGTQAFKGCTAQTDFLIPESVISIGEGAFMNCTGLRYITIPATLTTLGAAAFEGCTHLTDVLFPGNPATLTWNRTEGRPDFQAGMATRCHVLSSQLDAFNTKYAGLNATVVDDLDFGDGLTWTFSRGALSVSRTVSELCGMPDFASKEAVPWHRLRGIVTAVAIADSVTTIGSYAFADCNNVAFTTINLPNLVNSVGQQAFEGCSQADIIQLSHSLATIGKAAFRGCSGVKGISIPNSVLSIGEEAFKGCTNLTDITLGSSLVNIGESAFEGCSAVNSISNYTDPEFLIWPASSNDEFKPAKGTQCEVPTEFLARYQANFAGVNVTFKACNPSESGFCGSPTLEDVRWDFYTSGKLMITGTGSMKDYGYEENKAPWESHKVNTNSIVVGNGVKRIGSYAFLGTVNDQLKTVLLPNSVTAIGEGAFAGCTHMTGIFLGTSMNTIESYAFAACSSLISITIPASVTSIGESAFRSCTALTDIYCYADPFNLTWTWTENSEGFKADKATRCHVLPQYLADYQQKFPSVNVTFMGDLSASTNQITEGAFAGYWTTYYSIGHMQAPEGVTVYKGVVDGERLTLTKIADGIIKAGEGVILKSTTSDAIVFTEPVVTPAGDYTDNSLKGVAVQTTIAGSAFEGKYIYTLSNGSNGLGFFKYYAPDYTTNTTLGANKAFLAFDAVPASRGFTFSYGDDNTTDISGVADEAGTVYYDLQGRRVDQPAKGLYIRKGKIVVIK